MKAGASTTHWVRSPGWDATWMFSGLWAPVVALVLFAIARVGVGPEVTVASPGFDLKALGLIYLPLSVLHRITTTYAVLGTPIFREEIKKSPGVYLYVPLAILLGCVGLSLAFVFHDVFGIASSPHGRLWAFFVLAYVMMAWERWHFCAQEFGVLSIYRVRAGQAAPGDKRFDRFYTVALMLGVNMVLFVRFGYEDLTQVALHGVSMKQHASWLVPSGHVAFAFGAALIAYALVRELRRPDRSLPKLLYYVLVGSHTVLLYFFPTGLALFFLSYVLHHWMVSVGLFGLVTLHAYQRQLGSPGAALRGLALRVTPWLALAVLWYLAFDPIDKAGNLAPVPGEAAFTGMSLGAKLLVGVVMGVFFALNYLHYYYDRCFYAFSNPAVRRTVGPLLFGTPAAKPNREPSASQPPQPARAA